MTKGLKRIWKPDTPPPPSFFFFFSWPFTFAALHSREAEPSVSQYRTTRSVAALMRVTVISLGQSCNTGHSSLLSITTQKVRLLNNPFCNWRGWEQKPDSSEEQQEEKFVSEQQEGNSCSSSFSRGDATMWGRKNRRKMETNEWNHVIPTSSGCVAIHTNFNNIWVFLLDLTTWTWKLKKTSNFGPDGLWIFSVPGWKILF